MGDTGATTMVHSARAGRLRHCADALCAAAVVLLTSCGSPQPTCIDQDVQGLVHQLATHWLQRNWHEVGRAYGEFYIVPMALDGIGAWEQVLLYSEKERLPKRIVSIVTGLSESMQPLDGVRTTGSNENLRWRSCAATLPMHFDGVDLRLPLKYIVQYTEEGQLYAELTSVL